MWQVIWFCWYGKVATWKCDMQKKKKINIINGSRVRTHYMWTNRRQSPANIAHAYPFESNTNEAMSQHPKCDSLVVVQFLFFGDFMLASNVVGHKWSMCGHNIFRECYFFYSRQFSAVRRHICWSWHSLYSKHVWKIFRAIGASCRLWSHAYCTHSRCLYILHMLLITVISTKQQNVQSPPINLVSFDTAFNIAVESTRYLHINMTTTTTKSQSKKI